jgi:predicted DsbA family dithiol-disulfide isomerase
MKPEKVKIEVWSDVVCPFCFLGKKKLERAIAKADARDKVEIIWHSFQLDPDFPMDTSLPSTKNLSERKGYPIEQVTAMCAQLAEQGKAFDIDFQFDKALTFNTRDAHRLIQWGKAFNKSSELKEAFMKAHFSEGIDLALKENLLSVVEQVGLNRGEAKKVLESDAFSQDVQEDILRSRQLGIGGVPYFLVDEKEAISGAQDDQVFDRVIAAALKQQEAESK